MFQVQKHPLPAATNASYCSLPADVALVTGIMPQGNLPVPKLSPAANEACSTVQIISSTEKSL